MKVNQYFFNLMTDPEHLYQFYICFEVFFLNF